MSQLRLAYVNLKVVSPSTKPRSQRSAALPVTSPDSPPLVRKAAELHARNQRAAGVIESLIDDMLAEIEARG